MPFVYRPHKARIVFVCTLVYSDPMRVPARCSNDPIHFPAAEFARCDQFLREGFNGTPHARPSEQVRCQLHQTVEDDFVVGRLREMAQRGGGVLLILFGVVAPPAACIELPLRFPAGQRDNAVRDPELESAERDTA